MTRPHPPPQADALPARRVPSRRLDRHGACGESERAVPDEAAVALVHDASTTAVMMATPADLEDLALGFSLTEGLVAARHEIEATEVVETDLGYEARMWLAAPRAQALAQRRRRMAGPTGCGLCGIDSLAAALRQLPTAPEGLTLKRAEVFAAVEALEPAQALGALTRAVHAAGWWSPADGLVCAREDVGRHNALDKLAGALARSAAPPTAGAVVLTSRVSVEMVQKAAMIGASILIAVSAPTALAIRTAERAGLTLVGVARRDAFEVFTRPDRIG